MEADWAAEVGAGLPGIEADWAGFVDLRINPFRLSEIAEASEYPVLWEMLVDLNDAFSRVFSVKCDVWALGAEEIDPLEFDCVASGKIAGMASYIDIVLRDNFLLTPFAWHERWARAAVDRLRASPLRAGRVDLVIRAARAGGREGFGITLYAAGCGADTQAARGAWEGILRAGVAATMETVPPGASSSIG